jgi:hypothetical protein
LVDALPGGLTLWISVLLCGLFPFAFMAASSERMLIGFGIVCGVFAVVFWAFGLVWLSAVIIEKRGWLGLLLHFIGFGQVGYLSEYWDECGRPVCLSVLAPIAFGLVFMVGVCAHCLTHL